MSRPPDRRTQLTHRDASLFFRRRRPLAVAASATGASAAHSRWLIAALALAAFVNHVVGLALSPFLPLLADELGASLALIGQVPSLSMLLAAILGLVIGPLADQYGYRHVLMLGLLSAIVSTLATALAPSYPLLLVAVLVGAIGRATVLPTAQAVVTSRFQDAARRRAVGWITTGLSGAAVGGIPLLTTVAALAHWRASFLMLSGIVLVTGLLLGRLLGDEDAPKAQTPGLRVAFRAYAPLVRHRPTMVLISASLVGYTGMWAIWTYIAALLFDRFGLGIQGVGIFYLATGAIALIGNMLAGGRLSARPRPLMAWSRLAGGLVIAVALFAPLPALVAVGLLALSGLSNAVNSVASVVLLTAESPAARATTLTFNFSAQTFGVALGGGLGGLALVLGGFDALGAVAVACVLSSAGLIWLSDGKLSALERVAPTGEGRLT